MDTLLFSRQNQSVWAATMINLEARQLVNTANTVAAMHLHDGLSRIQFVDEIRSVIISQFEAARRAKTDDECMACIKALRAENHSLLEQSRALKTGYAKLYAEVKVVREDNKIIGYIISAVDVVVAGVAIFGGIVMMSSMNPLGVVAGAVIVVNGFNTISREAARTFLGDRQTEGIFADGSMEVAEFLGFSRQQGLGTYKAVTLFSEVYGAYGLRLKPETRRLWYWTRPDFFRKVSGTPRPVMALKIAGWGINAKVALDLLSIDPGGK
ncbi:DUF4225 domain-containing protein [Kosakonia radicincitans]|uniref:DUF4225 domain-containing protein n=1 Tax=Kosakonia radicincitans TaxID=283686 RepID=UPI002368336D|nr:DUF4225 domain-containing protein [Kosakonia radicincitans]MDD7998239.1 DUF4225 domain-containing protein [Kosakonia radicincitans]